MGRQKKRGKKKAITRAFTLMRKVDTVNGSEEKKGQEKDNNSRFYAGLESQHSRQVAKKKGKKKATTPAFMLVRKVNTLDGSPKKRTRKRQLALLR